MGGLALLALVVIGFLWKNYFTANTNFSEKSKYLYIPTGAKFEQVMDSIQQNNLIKNISTFQSWAQRRNYAKVVKAGRYKIKNGMSNNDIIVMLRSGKQAPVNITFNKFRDVKSILTAVSKKLECSERDLNQLFFDPNFLASHQLSNETLIGIFIPNTYQFNWNTSAEQFFDRVKAEYEIFWNEERHKKLEKTHLNPMQVMTIASIVEEETNFNPEKPRIAGVYLNRVRENWPLGADPTVKFAVGDFTLKRILNEHLEVNSPYNTYKNIGIPPGPICTPSPSSIDAVLDAENHDYMYFCASPKFDGTHEFAETGEEHVRNAALYQAELNKRKIGFK